MATHSSTLAWKIPWTEEPCRLQSMGSLRVGHDWATSLSCTGEGNGNPLQCSCLKNPRDGGAWWAAIYGVAQSWIRLKWLRSSSIRTLKRFRTVKMKILKNFIPNRKVHICDFFFPFTGHLSADVDFQTRIWRRREAVCRKEMPLISSQTSTFYVTLRFIALVYSGKEQPSFVECLYIFAYFNST